MPTTANHNLPYPAGTDPAVVPDDVQALAEQVDSELDQIGLGQIVGATAGRLLVANASGVITDVVMFGDATLSPTGALAIGENKIGNGHVKSDAAIALSKLANITAGRMLIGNSSNVPTATAMSGDATLSSTGALTIGSSKVTNGKIAADAVTGDKLNLSSSSVARATDSGAVGPNSTSTVVSTGSLPAGKYLVTATVVVKVSSGAGIGTIILTAGGTLAAAYGFELNSNVDYLPRIPMSINGIFDLESSGTFAINLNSGAYSSHVAKSGTVITAVRIG